MKKSAVISSCGKYRYELRREWDSSKSVVLFIGLNPSTADAEQDDHTVRTCINYARRWGYGALQLGNLFAYRSTESAALNSTQDPIGPDNDKYLIRLQRGAALVVCAWGSSINMRGRDSEVLALLNDPYCLVRLKGGQPGHPLYKPASLDPIPLYKARPPRE